MSKPVGLYIVLNASFFFLAIMRTRLKTKVSAINLQLLSAYVALIMQSCKVFCTFAFEYVDQQMCALL